MSVQLYRLTDRDFAFITPFRLLIAGKTCFVYPPSRAC